MIEGWNHAKIHNALLQKAIKWFFNPLGASHHGGVWERLVRSICRVLGALVKEQSLDGEGLTRESKSIINGRPLTTDFNDSKNLELLTPNHLQLCDNTALPLGLFVKRNMYSRRRWQQVQYLAHVF